MKRAKPDLISTSAAAPEIDFTNRNVKTNKNYAANAEAICEAVGRPKMRFVPIKNVDQQTVMALHRVRQGFVKARTAQAIVGSLASSVSSSFRKASAYVAGSPFGGLAAR